MKETITIKSDRLELEVLKPYSELYRRTRFNWNCFVNSIVLDGKYQFAEPEQRDPKRGTSGGWGLNSEYKFEETRDMAKIGEEYPRLGNGYLMKTDKDFHFMVNEPCRPFPTVCTATASSVTFVTDMPLCQGIAGREEKTVSVSGNTVTITTKLTNYGQKDIVAEEYNHNFLSLGGEPVTPAYHVEAKYFENLENGEVKGDNIYGRDGIVSLRRNPTEPYMIFMNDVKRDAPYTWKLYADDSTLSVTEQDSFVPSRAVIWGVEHCFCTEVFVALNIKPMESYEWTRTWTFDC